MIDPQPPSADEPFGPPVGQPVIQPIGQPGPGSGGPPSPTSGPADVRPVVISSRGTDRARRANQRPAPLTTSTAGTWVAVTLSFALVAAAGVVAWWLVRDSGDTPIVAAIPSTLAAPEAPAASAASATTAAPTTPAVASTRPVEPAVPAAPTAPVVEVGQAVRFTLPDGYSQQLVPPGVEITDGTLRLYAQVANRIAGEDPLVVLQEYVNSFDTLYPSAAYSQVIPLPADTSGVAAVDGYLVHYRVLAADGTGYAGVVDVTRRADGLVSLTDLYVPVDAAAVSGDQAVAAPASVAEELYESFLQTPAVGPEALLAPLPPTRVSSVHPSITLDGVVAVMLPVGWIDDGSGVGSVSVTHPAGQHFVVERLADAASPAAAETQSAAALQRVWPGTSLGPFAVSREGEPGGVRSSDASFTATAADGQMLEGIVRVWFDTARGQVFHAAVVRIAGQEVQPGHESFLLAQVDIALTRLR